MNAEIAAEEMDWLFKGSKIVGYHTTVSHNIF